MIWIDNTDGKPDAVLTMAFIGFVVVLVKLILSGVTLGNLGFGTIDAPMIGAVLGPTLSAYVLRRYTDRRLPPPAKE